MASSTSKVCFRRCKPGRRLVQMLYLEVAADLGTSLQRDAMNHVKFTRVQTGQVARNFLFSAPPTFEKRQPLRGGGRGRHLRRCCWSRSWWRGGGTPASAVAKRWRWTVQLLPNSLVSGNMRRGTPRMCQENRRWRERPATRVKVARSATKSSYQAANLNRYQKRCPL